jgi:TPR repeat protein
MAPPVATKILFLERPVGPIPDTKLIFTCQLIDKTISSIPASIAANFKSPPQDNYFDGYLRFPGRQDVQVSLEGFNQKTFQIWAKWREGGRCEEEISAEDLMSLYEGSRFVQELDLALISLKELACFPDLDDWLIGYILENLFAIISDVDQLWQHEPLVDFLEKYKGKFASQIEKIAESGAVFAMHYLYREKNLSKEPLKWLKLAAERGYAPAQSDWGFELAQQGNYREAAKWYELAAHQGYLIGAYNLADLYLRNRLGEKQESQAIFWMKKLAEAGYAPAQLRLALFYAAASDQDQAVYWYEKAAEQGEPQAQNNLAVLYAEGAIGNVKNYERAFILWKQAADQQFPAALNNLGKLYKNGHIGAVDGKPNYAKARKYFSLAAQLGVASAQAALQTLPY